MYVDELRTRVQSAWAEKKKISVYSVRKRLRAFLFNSVRRWEMHVFSTIGDKNLFSRLIQFRDEQSVDSFTQQKISETTISPFQTILDFHNQMLFFLFYCTIFNFIALLLELTFEWTAPKANIKNNIKFKVASKKMSLENLRQRSS